MTLPNFSIFFLKYARKKPLFDESSFLEFQGGSVPAATKSRLSPLPPEPAGFYDRNAPIDIPLDSGAVCLLRIVIQ